MMEPAPIFFGFIPTVKAVGVLVFVSLGSVLRCGLMHSLFTELYVPRTESSLPLARA